MGTKLRTDLGDVGGFEGQTSSAVTTRCDGSERTGGGSLKSSALKSTQGCVCVGVAVGVIRVDGVSV